MRVLRVAIAFAAAFLPLAARPAEAGSPVAGQQQIVCNTGYSIDVCREQAAALRRMLVRYHAERLGAWTWVLVRSDDWRQISRMRGLDLDSPAFTYLPRKETFLEEALVAAVPGRQERLLAHWSESVDGMLELAVTHELGHALCRETDEHDADANGARLRRGQDVICGQGRAGSGY